MQESQFVVELNIADFVGVFVWGVSLIAALLGWVLLAVYRMNRKMGELKIVLSGTDGAGGIVGDVAQLWKARDKHEEHIIRLEEQGKARGG